MINKRVAGIKSMTIIDNKAHKKMNPVVEAIKMRKNAKGDSRVEENRRIYLNIGVEDDEKMYVVFVNKEKSVGRMLDDVCALIGLKNTNDTPGTRVN